MPMFIRMPVRISARISVLVALLLIVVSCSESDDANFQGPNLPTGPGTVFSVQTVSFTTSDNVLVSARFGKGSNSAASPVVILMHDITRDGREWELVGLEMMQRLLEEGYLVLIIDSRGHGLTPLPADGRPAQSLSVFDIESLHLEVSAALNWVATQPAADRSRVGIMGVGMGGNAAYVSMGVFPDDLKTGIALSPGIFNLNTGEALGIGTAITPFEPHTMLFIASQNDLLPVNQTQSTSATAIAASMLDVTAEPKRLDARPANLHGSLLLQDPDVFDAVLVWLETHL
jgi:dienelactone hydrolase